VNETAREVKGKGKGKFVPVIKHYAMKAYGGVNVEIHFS
jgi:hypothetical protein